MNQTRSKSFAAAILTLAFPLAALADFSQTTTLQANTALSLDTGAVTSVGLRTVSNGDIAWNGSTITPSGNATALNIGVGAFGALTQGTLNLPCGLF